MKKLWLALPFVLALSVVYFTPGPHPQNDFMSPTPSPDSAPPAHENHPPGETTSKSRSDTDTLPTSRIQPTESTPPPSTATNVDENYRYEPVNLYPSLSWNEKMKLYFHGRSTSAVRYPLGLDFQGVQQLSDNVYSIDQQEFLQQSDKQDLLTHARIDDSSGRPTFSEVVPGGVFDRLGILSGDQITALDGSTIHSYSDLYSAYQGIQGRNEVTLDIQRNGHNIQFTYFIQ